MANPTLVKRDKVQVVVFFSDDENFHLLLLQTNQRRGLFWQNVTGGVEKDDRHFFAAAKREVEEELGVSPNKIFDLDKSFSFIDQWNTHVTEHCFFTILPIEQKSKITLDPGEHQDFKVIPVNEVQESDYKFRNNYEVFLEGRDYVEKESFK